MCLLRMRYLLFVSGGLFFFSCVSPYKGMVPVKQDGSCITELIPSFQTTWYTASIDVMGRPISGLLLIKEMPDQSIRIVFMNEPGIKFLDFEFSDTSFKAHYVMKQLDRKPVIETLRKDFERILVKPLAKKGLVVHKMESELFFEAKQKKEVNYFITDKDCTSLSRVENASKRKKKMELHFMNWQGNVPDSMYIKHHTFSLQMNFRRLDK